MTAPAQTDAAMTGLIPIAPEAPEDRVVRAAMSWVGDQTCSFALAELEDAVAALIDFRGIPALGSAQG